MDSSARPMTGALIGTGAAPAAGVAGVAGVVAVLEQPARSTALDNAAKPNPIVLAFIGEPRRCFRVSE
jgi:hypothetical protein